MKNSPYGWLEVGWTALKLGLTSFGGPIAHIGYFRTEYVERKRWLSEEVFAHLTALCQFLPGPASSQLGIAIGIQRAGLLGGIAAWLGFTLPSAVLMIVFAIAMQGEWLADAGWLQGLKLAAAAVVAQAVWSMARTLAPDRARVAMTVFTTGFTLLLPGALGQILPLIVCGVIGWLYFKPEPVNAPASFHPAVHSMTAVICLAMFTLLLIALPVIAFTVKDPLLQLTDIGYRAGSLVFGGGHVVLPMLEEETVASGIVSDQQFLAGYAAAQAVPGPLFTFSAYIGAVSAYGAEGAARAAAMLVAVFLPSFLLVTGVLPYWEKLRTRSSTRAMLAGVNASVVGLLLAALYDPIWTVTVHHAIDFVFVLIGFISLVFWRCPPWLLVIAAAAGGWMVYT
ncbi:hypothetical protein SD71_16975 [Cohnella kolymensis]|uniref:ChrA protein n=1 Tax=Cohnella kolymensis TaxID=1590652 RepID=A0ABR5A1F3_9BACL|nr:chromate efflux transporter [Cohnella kolymensis]KIL34747.1 hypothetical protein SD71_16975 [Cohnella kolymensis]